MPLSVVCSECRYAMKLRDELAGKRVRCPKCSATVSVPREPAAPPKQTAAKPRKASQAKGTPPARKSAPPKRRTPREDKTVGSILDKGDGSHIRKVKDTTPSRSAYNKRYQRFLDAFHEDRIEPVPTTGTYRFGIALVCLFMAFLPLLYVGTITVLTLLLPCVMLPMMVLLIVKPLFSSGGGPTGKRALDRDDEPLLFDFVDRICEAVGSPYPTEIKIDSQVNASASFRRGVLSMFGNDLSLTIGMPLVAGLNTRQLAGVLAHEFGHFAQGAGMRVTYLIRFVSMWFTRIVYERDSWDYWLESLSELPVPINLFFYCVRGLVWFCRRIMWCFMMLGHLVAGYMLRQMEFDADRYEARLAGSRCFAETARKLIHMGVAHQGAFEDLHEFYREGRLADNLPRLINANVEQLDDRAKKRIHRAVSKSETTIFDTHPCDRDRVAQVKEEAADGIFQLERPGEELFRRYDHQARAVTWDMYVEIFGRKLRKRDIHPVEQLLQRQKQQQENYHALFRFFQCAPSWYRPLRPPTLAVKPPRDFKETIAQVQRARQRVIKLAERYGVAWKKYDRADTRLIECELATALLKSRLRVPRDLFKVPLFTHDEIEQRQDAAEYIQGKQEPLLAPFEDAAAERLYAALRLLRHPTMQKRIEDYESLIAEVDELAELFGHINARLGQLLAIRNDQVALGLLLSMLDGNEGNRQLLARIFDLMHGMHDLIHDLYESLGDVPYPFDHADKHMTVGQFMLPVPPEQEDPGELYGAAESIGNSLPAIQTRVLGRMCQIAEIVESSLGLEKLPQPDIDEDEDEEDD